MASAKTWFRRLVLSAVAAVLVLYSGLTTWLWWAQDSLVFLPSREYKTLPYSAGLLHEDVDIEVVPGTKIRGWFVPATEKSRGTILYFHGNGGNLSSYFPRLAPLASAGFDSLSIDYEGYGASGGTPSEANLYRDADASWDWLTKSKGIDPRRIVVWGYSLGGAVATWCATRNDVGAVILENTFTTIPDVGARIYSWLPVKFVSHNDFSNMDRISAIRAPILIGHGKRDELVPFEMGKELHREAREPKRFVEFRGGHADGFSQSPEAWSEMTRFLEEAGFVTGP